MSLSPGARLVFPFGITPSPHADVSGALRVRVRRPEAELFEKVGDPIPLSNAPGPLTRLEARISASADAEGKRRVVIFGTDDNLNPIPSYRGKVAVQAEGSAAGLPAEVEIGADGRGAVEGVEVRGDRPVRIEVSDPERGLEARGGPAHSVGERGHYFGGIHFHTRLSVDGDREPRAAYAYARDHLNLDVVAMTDHAPIGPGWAECLAVNEEFNEPGRFVTIPAWESSNAYGHANLYLRTPEVDGGTWHWKPELCPSEVAWDRDVVMVPHHPNCGQPIEYGKHREVMGKSFYWSEYHWEFPNERATPGRDRPGPGQFRGGRPRRLLGHPKRRDGGIGAGCLRQGLAPRFRGRDRQPPGAPDATSGRLRRDDLFPGGGADPRGGVAGDGRALDLRDLGGADRLRLRRQRGALRRGGDAGRRRGGSAFLRQPARDRADRAGRDHRRRPVRLGGLARCLGRGDRRG